MLHNAAQPKVDSRWKKTTLTLIGGENKGNDHDAVESIAAMQPSIWPKAMLGSLVNCRAWLSGCVDPAATKTPYWPCQLKVRLVKVRLVNMRC